MTDVAHYVVKMHERRKRYRRYARVSLVIGGIYAIIVGFLWFVFRSPILRFHEIAVQMGRSDGETVSARAEVFSNGEVTDILRAAAFLRGNPFHLTIDNFLLWPDEFRGDALKMSPRMKEISIEKNYSKDMLVATVYGRTPFGIWCLRGGGTPECFWFDDEGILFERSVSAAGSLITVVNDYSRVRVGIGSPVLSRELIVNLFSVFRALPFADITPREINIRNLELQEIEITTYDGPTLYFSLRFPADESVTVIRELKKSSDFRKLSYIDFRVQNRVYYK